MSITLHNGDCLEVMKLLPDNSVDLIICDLPYGCLTGGGITKKETAEKYGRKGTEGISGCAWDIKIDLKKFWEQVKRIRKDDHTPCIHFCTTRFGYDLIKSNEDEFRYDLVWTKTNAVGFLQANKMPMRSHEMMYVFSKAGAYYERKDISGNFPAGGGGTRDNAQFIVVNCPSHTTGAGRRCVKSYVEVANKKQKGGHPTAKPIELYKWLIERYCPTGGTILDPTAGSFNSCVAGQELGMTCIGIEMNKEFYNKAVEKLGAE
jgi:site-specific DNA-methyltransferase (adenine-specific)